MTRLALVLGLLLTLMSCVTPVSFVGLTSGEVVVGERLLVRNDGNWSRMQGGTPVPKRDLWTTDGITLDQLRFYVGLAKGESLVAIKDRPADKPIPRFRDAMEAQEVVELYEAFATSDGSVFKLEKLAPARFLEADGFRFDFSRVRKSDDVRTRGVVYGAQHGKEWFLMAYEAPRIHYFPKNLPRVEAIAQSARVKSAAATGSGRPWP